ncbi:MAG TPA: EF-hand domain-containing protein [Rhodocyclaceae bacterium]|nr:EF-hand domain-containing protein [Rhodocyclaceae bacterium]
MSTISSLGSSTVQAWSGASMRKPPAQKMSDLFQKIDTNGSGSITKAQFEQAFQTMSPSKGFQQAGADAVWAKLDPNGTGSVSKQDFVGGMTSMMSQFRHGHHHQAQQAQQASANSSAAQTLSTSLDSLNSVGSNVDVMA